MSAEETPQPGPLLRAFEAWGSMWNTTFRLMGGVTYLMRDVSVWLFYGAFTNKVRFGRFTRDGCITTPHDPRPRRHADLTAAGEGAASAISCRRVRAHPSPIGRKRPSSL